ncbi:MAG: thioesterase family protein [Gammaproteobacteria bacterium]|nr:thioesterase family protein [Gammaproteobacteria bacterium]MDE0283779.1 thioesterase family protein [Gammaproteobacteria bacterium]MDE0513230.1 thioesterase family protein [Gammaproteobacteria bacterium]
MSISAPLKLYKDLIVPEWIDYNGHMNVSYYVLVFDRATDEFFDFMGMDAEYRAANNVSAFTAEMHVNYIGEVKEGEEVYVTTQLLGYDEKRFHYFHRMYQAEQGYLAATSELLCLFVDMSQRRVTQMPPPILDRLAEIKQSHAELPLPEQVGSVMRVNRV